MIEAALRQRRQSTRIHTVGVGNAVNRSLLSPVARVGGGVEVIIAPGEPVVDAVAALTARTLVPLLVDLELGGSALLDEEHPPRDLYAGAPATLLVRVKPEGGLLELRGRSAQETWVRQIEVPPTPEGTGPAHLPACWAREQVEELETRCAAGQSRDAELEALGLAYQISTRRTSWVARTPQRVVAPELDPIYVVQPQAPVAAMTALGIGLRPVVEQVYRASLRSSSASMPFGEVRSAKSGCAPILILLLFLLFLISTVVLSLLVRLL